MDTIFWNTTLCSQTEVNRLSKERSASVFRVEKLAKQQRARLPRLLDPDDGDSKLTRDYTAQYLRRYRSLKRDNVHHYVVVTPFPWQRDASDLLHNIDNISVRIKNAAKQSDQLIEAYLERNSPQLS